MKSFHLISHSGSEIMAYSWLPDNPPQAIIQIAHGMQEYAGRYDHFARWLNEKGVAVYAEDHIGHGSSINSMEDIAHFPGSDDWQRQVDILHHLTMKIKALHPGVPVFLLGHSMGSVLTQTYMMRYGLEVSGYILSGAIRQPYMMAMLGRGLAWALSVIYGKKNRSNLIISLGYGRYNRYFRPARTEADWLCSNPSTVDEYVASPLCGVPLTNMFYRNFFYGFSYIARKNNLRKIPSDRPVLIAAGKDDPAGFFGKAPELIRNRMEKYSGANVILRLYPGFRHEILNEAGKESVYLDIYSWLIKNIPV